MADGRKMLRCAVYTRKSSEHGLEQDFNSLDAQREAAEAYIKSQAHEGWKLLKTHYADGGLSGGTLERPALHAAGFSKQTTAAKTPRMNRQNYPWCAYYSGGRHGGGGTNCGFTTFQQCLDTVSGIGGFCQRNTQYQPPPGPHSSKRQHRYHY
jgi:hypothetical protein